MTKRGVRKRWMRKRIIKYGVGISRYDREREGRVGRRRGKGGERERGEGRE